MAIEQMTTQSAQELQGDYLKDSPYDIATAFGFNWNKDRKELAVDAGITNYTGQGTENLQIKKMLLDTLEKLKAASSASVIKDTKIESDDLKIELKERNLYDTIINTLSINDGKISLNSRENVQISRDSETKNRTSDVIDMPLLVDGKGILVAYTDPDTQEKTVLAIDNFNGTTFSFRNTTAPHPDHVMYSAPFKGAGIDQPEVTIAQDRVVPEYMQPKQVAQIPSSNVDTPVIPESYVADAGAIEGNAEDETVDNSHEKEEEIATPEDTSENKAEIAGNNLVLTEHMMTHRNEEGTEDIYTTTLENLNPYWLGKKVDFSLGEGDEKVQVKGDLQFVGGILSIVNKDQNGNVTVEHGLTPYKVTPDYITIYGSNDTKLNIMNTSEGEEITQLVPIETEIENLASNTIE